MATEDQQHKAGFINIIGKPNVGKSTLMNKLVGEKLSIVTSKAQTTRHRIFGIVSEEDYQMVFSDTPGILDPKYELHKSMMDFVDIALKDADILLLLTDLFDDPEDFPLREKLNNIEAKLILLINKIDLGDEAKVLKLTEMWQDKFPDAEIIPISALTGFNLKPLEEKLLEYLPVHPAYFPKDALTDKPERFFAAEIIREKIFLNYKKEIPYSCEVVIESFKEEEDIIRIRAEIYVERQSQKGIIIGKKGEAIKKVGIESREEMEQFFDKKVFLEQFVKVLPDWRKREGQLRRFGYKTK